MSALAASHHLAPGNQTSDLTSLPMQPSGGLADRFDRSVRANQVISYVKRRVERSDDASDNAEPDAFGPVELMPDESAAAKISTAQIHSQLSHIFDYQPVTQNQETFTSSKEWDGYVTELFEDRFRGVIYPVSLGGGESEELIEIPLNFVDENVRGEIREGSVFRLATGQSKRKRQIMHGTKIYFRKALRLRKPPMVSEALEELFAE